jgi:LPS export ABC transporter protein LptC/lipopolysaccharide transport protein LptA
MGQYYRKFRLSLRALIFLVAFGWIAACPFVHAEDSQQKFEGFNLEGYADNGEKAWDVNGDSADFVGPKIKISNVVGNSYGKQPMNVTADTGYIDQASGDMRLEKDVVITHQDGGQLLTDSLDWNKKADLVTTPDNVMIVDDQITVTGKGLEAQPGLKTAKINEDVIVKVKTDPELKNSKTVTITSDGPMVINQAEGVAVFKDNVIAIQEDKTLKADRMEVYLNKDANQINEIVCIGNVVIVQGENKSFADRAVYNAVQQKLTLSGRPKLIMLTEGENPFATVGN